MIQISLDVLRAQFRYQLHALDARFIAHGDHERIVNRRRFGCDAAHILHHDHAFDAHAEAHAGGILSAQILHHAIVAPAAAHGKIALRRFGDDFKHGLRVIIQSAHDAGIDRIFNAQRVQILFQLFKMLRAVGAEVIQHGGRVGQLIGIFLAIQNAQRIAGEAILTGFAQRTKLRLQIGLQLFVIRLAAFGAADGIDRKLQIADAVRLQHFQRQRNDLRIQTCILCAEYLHAVLMELAQAAGLRLFIAEARAGGVVHLAGQRIAQMVFDKGARRARGAFGL